MLTVHTSFVGVMARISRRISLAELIAGAGARPKILIAALSVLVAIGLWRFVIVAVSTINHQQDFACLWLAGRLWNSGISPYGSEYALLGEASAELVQVTEKPHALYYPPTWSSLMMPVGLLPYRLATPMWTALNILGVLASQLAIFFSIKPERRSFIALLSGLLFCLFVNGTRFTLVLGQTSIVVMLGLSIIVLGIARDKFWLRCFGLTLVMLKPNIGIVLAVPMLWYDFRAVFVAGAMSLVLAIPALAIESPVSIIAQLASNISNYSNYPINTVAAQTGIATVLYVISGLDISAAVLSVVGAVTAFAMFIWYSKKVRPDDEVWFGYLWITSATAASVVRFHMHDMVMVALLVQPLFLFKMNNAARVCCLAFMALLLRPERMAVLLNFYSQDAFANMSNFLGANLLASVGMIGVAAALILYLALLDRDQRAPGIRAA